MPLSAHPTPPCPCGSRRTETNRLGGRLDPASGQADWAMGTGRAGTRMVWAHPSGSPVITTNIGSETVSALERGANPLAWSLTQIPTGKGPEGLDVSPDDTELWVAHSRDGGLSIVDVAAKKVTSPRASTCSPPASRSF